MFRKNNAISSQGVKVLNALCTKKRKNAMFLMKRNLDAFALGISVDFRMETPPNILSPFSQRETTFVTSYLLPWTMFIQNLVSS